MDALDTLAAIRAVEIEYINDPNSVDNAYDYLNEIFNILDEWTD